MTRGSTLAKAGAVSLALLCGTVPAQGISPAEKILFQSDQLGNVAGPKTLRYDYVRREPAGTGFSDKVQVEVGAKRADGNAEVSSQFLSGDRQIALPPLSGAQGNPAVLGFLERDISEMKRMTGGSINYFRKRIRLALAEAASVEPVSVSYAGHQVQGRKVVIRPFLNDPMQDKMRKYVAKNYEFILSDDVPGAVYRLRSVVPGEQLGAQKADTVLIEETMTVAGAGSPP